MHCEKKNQIRTEKVNFMNIFVAVNEAYLDPLGVMLYSLQYHNPLYLKVYILHLDISKHIQKEFCKKVSKWGKRLKIYFLKVDANNINKNIRYGRYGIEAVLRLTLLKVLPLNMNKILWIDADIIVKGNIQKLYEVADYGQYAVVCEDMFPKKEKYELYSKLGLKMADKYFNSGIMLFYLSNMRKDFKEDEFLQWMDDNPDKLNYPDQNTLNLCLKRKLCWVKPEIYNLQLLRVTPHMKNSGMGECEFWRYGIRVLGIKSCLKHYIKKLMRSKL